MPFSKGQQVFALVFFCGFVLSMVWAYSKDKQKQGDYFSGAYKIIFWIIFIVLLLWGFVKIKTRRKHELDFS